MNERLRVSGLGVAAVLTLAACAGGTAVRSEPASSIALPAGVTPQMIGQGETVFAEHCTTCHGSGGEGTTMAPGLNDGEWTHGDGSFESIVEIVNVGVPEPVRSFIPMLPRAGADISDAEVRAVAAYVWSLSSGA
jgi:cbb3-type cytochrome c oxidase subunit III